MVERDSKSLKLKEKQLTTDSFRITGTQFVSQIDYSSSLKNLYHVFIKGEVCFSHLNSAHLVAWFWVNVLWLPRGHDWGSHSAIHCECD